MGNGSFSVDARLTHTCRKNKQYDRSVHNHMHFDATIAREPIISGVTPTSAMTSTPPEKKVLNSDNLARKTKEPIKSREKWVLPR